MKLTVVIRSPEWLHIKDCLKRFLDVYPLYDQATMEVHLEEAEG